MKDSNPTLQDSGLSSATPTVHDDPSISQPVRGEKNKNMPNDDDDGETRSTEEDVLIVDWEGPDDPRNPKKCVIYQFKKQQGLTICVRKRPCTFKQLVLQEEMGCNVNRLRVYLYQSSLLFHDGTCQHANRAAVRYHEHFSHCADYLGLRCRIWSVYMSLKIIERVLTYP